MSSTPTSACRIAALFCTLALLCGIVSGCSSNGNSDQSQSAASESTASSSSSSDDASTQQSSATSSTTRKDKNGFDPETNSPIIVAGITFQLPSYYGTPQTHNGSDTYQAETGRGTSQLFVQTVKSQLDTAEFNRNKGGYVQEYLRGFQQSGFNVTNVQTEEAELVGMPAVKFDSSFNFKGTSGVIKGLFFLNKETKELGILVIQTSNESKYDYLPDFDRILDSASIAQPSVNSSAETADSSVVNPDLKETMDSYEAFMDEYINFMKRYKESDDAMSLLQDYNDYMTKYVDLTQKVEKLDTSNMSATDYAYYAEVTTRVSKKLLEASV